MTIATPVKTLFHPDTGQKLKLGRLKPKSKGPMLSLGNYLLRKFPAPPPAVDYSINLAARACLTNVEGNDIAGCCTVSAAAHVKGVLLGNSGQPIDFGPQDVLSVYKLLSGWNGIEDDVSDTGLDEITVLNFWMQTGLVPNAAQHKISGAIKIDPNDPGEMKAAIWLFENLYITASLPDAWVTPMPDKSGFIWDDVGPPDPENGHAFMAMAYNASEAGVIIDTWGMFGLLTWAALAQYCSVYSVLAEDEVIVASQKSPAGFNWTQLLSDLESMGGAV